jgi:polynucleotide 5'-kinase involved in rRNA processing
MPLTKTFNETVKTRIQQSEGFRRALLREAVSCMIAGDVETGKSVLRKYMLSSTGNPQARNLFEIVAYLQKSEGTVLEVVDRAAA